MGWWESVWQGLAQTGRVEDFLIICGVVVFALWMLVRTGKREALIFAAIFAGLVALGLIVDAVGSIATVHRLGLLHVTCCAATIYVVVRAIRRRQPVGQIAYQFTVGCSVPITIFATMNGWSHVPWTLADTLQLFGITLLCGLVWAIHLAGYPKKFSELKVWRTSEEWWTGVTYGLVLFALAVFLPVLFPWGLECTTAKCRGAGYWIGPAGSVSNLYLSQWSSALVSVVIGSAIVRAWRRDGK